MGTINYKTSDYITLGCVPQYVGDFDGDKDEIIDEMIENGYGSTPEDVEPGYEDYVRDLIRSYEEDDLYQAQQALEKHNFEFFNVSIEPGYYEGFTVDIDAASKWMIYFDDGDEKRRALKEAAELQEFLTECANDYGMRSCAPWWVMTFDDRETTLKAIKKAVATIRKDINGIPCYRTWARQQGIA